MTYADALFVVGALVFLAGVALVYVPAAVMLAGLTVAGYAWVDDLAKRRKERA